MKSILDLLHPRAVLTLPWQVQPCHTAAQLSTYFPTPISREEKGTHQVCFP